MLPSALLAPCGRGDVWDRDGNWDRVAAVRFGSAGGALCISPDVEDVAAVKQERAELGLEMWVAFANMDSEYRLQFTGDELIR